MHTELKQFVDQHNSDYTLRVDSGATGALGIMIVIENVATKKLMKFFLKPEDVEEFKVALDRAKGMT